MQPVYLAGLDRIRVLLWALLVSPLVLLIFAPSPGFYAHYGAVLGPSFTPIIQQYHIAVGAGCQLSSMAAFGLLILQRRVWPTLFRVLPFVMIATWLVGKRNSLFLAVVLIWIALWVRGQITPSRLVLWGSATAALLLAYSNWYQAALRPVAVLDPQRAYEIFRLDYGRDQDLRTALYWEMNPGRPILSYRGESVVFDLTMAVPRVVWSEKPLPYSTYMTAAALSQKPRFFGWGVTTSILDESVADFSWFGLLIGPLVLALICRIGDRADALGKSLSVLIGCLLLTVEVQAFAMLILCWAVYIVWSGRAMHPRLGLQQFRYVTTPRAAQGI